MQKQTREAGGGGRSKSQHDLLAVALDTVARLKYEYPETHPEYSIHYITHLCLYLISLFYIQCDKSPSTIAHRENTCAPLSPSGIGPETRPTLLLRLCSATLSLCYLAPLNA